MFHLKFIRLLLTTSIIQYINGDTVTSLNSTGCGKNAYIESYNDASNKPLITCRCNRNSTGTPPNCKIHCKYQSCSRYLYCSYDGSCQRGCRVDKCNSEDPNPECICPKNNYCNPQTHLCKVGCSLDKNCKNDEYCDLKEHKCNKKCETDADCFDNKFCSHDNKCLSSCESHSNCAPTKYCEDLFKRCQNICTNFACGENANCNVVNRTRYCSCKDGFIMNGNGGCRRKLNEENDDCTKCGTKSKCTLINGKPYCYCEWNLYYNSPLMTCEELNRYFGFG